MSGGAGVVPSDCRYTDRHQWLRLEDGAGVVGITHFAQQQLGEVTYVELPDVGEHLDADEVFGSVESMKSLSDVHAPVAGEVIAVNHAVEGQPTLLNEDPYGDGWLIHIHIDEPAALDGLLSAEQYAERFAS